MNSLWTAAWAAGKFVDRRFDKFGREQVLIPECAASHPPSPSHAVAANLTGEIPCNKKIRIAGGSFQKTPSGVSRRDVLASAAGLAATAAVGVGRTAHADNPAPAGGSADYKIVNGRINQSVVYWCFEKLLTYDVLAAWRRRDRFEIGRIGVARKLADLEKARTDLRHGPSHPFTQGFAHKEEHDECLAMLRKRIDQTADFGFPSVITFSGMRRGLSDEEGVANMIAGLKQIVGYAEKKKITVCLEMLNSRVHITMKGHPDYFCDQIERSIEVIRGVGSPRLKLLYDIYHVQIMEGDVISRIRQFHEYIGHYHTAGVPGRNELDDTQEINYAPIMEAIVATGYKGYVGQEFIPAHATPLAVWPKPPASATFKRSRGIIDNEPTRKYFAASAGVASRRPCFDRRALQASLSPTDVGTRAIAGKEFLAELQRRSAAFKDGTMAVRPAAEVIKDLRRIDIERTRRESPDPRRR